jgi:squamous cell carcinoma antigen recognized by T-cells 3
MIKSMHLTPKDSTLTATIEFEARDDALTAQTKDQKSYGENVISVSIGTGTTLYVTNFPPTADEAWIRNQFSKVGTLAISSMPQANLASSSATSPRSGSHH